VSLPRVPDNPVNPNRQHTGPPSRGTATSGCALFHSARLGYHHLVRILITGVTGFVGRHLCNWLHAHHLEVELFGLRRWRSDESPDSAVDRVHSLDGDLLDPASLASAVRTSVPDGIIHLAASSSVAGSWATPVEMMHVNALGTLHLLETARQFAPAARIVLASSAEIYGAVAPADLPITEDQPLRPCSPYAASKAAADLLGFEYYSGHGLRTVRLRLFNHCGPAQPARFVVASLARQVAEVSLGLRQPEIVVGDLEVRRDFIDVRDAAAAYWLALTAGEDGAAYNVASGHSLAIGDVLHRLLDLAGITAEIVVDPGRTRPADIAELVGDPRRFVAATGWHPRYEFDRTLADTLAFWRDTLTTSILHA